MEALLRFNHSPLERIGVPRVLLRSARLPISITRTRRRGTATYENAGFQSPPIVPPPASRLTSFGLPHSDRLKDAKPFSHFLTDSFDRQHTYLRISVTERCNLRCTYCMPPEGVPLSPPAHLLTTPEIVYLSELFVKQGVTKIRLTGGEPTVRKDILSLMQEIGSLRSKGLKELCLTTNGISLHRKLESMVEAGLTGINLSLDTLDPFQFQIMTRRKGFDAVMKSLERILELNRCGAGIKLKLNAVIMRGVNERELVAFVELGRENDIEVRFIEYMPFDGNKWSQQKMLSYKEMVSVIQQKYPGLSKTQEGGKNETSKTWQVPGFVGKVGFITSMTENFCGTCNRLRITGDGNLKVCLFGNGEVSLRDLLRKEYGGEPLDQAAVEAMNQIEMDRRQGLASSTGPLGYGGRERELLEVIGMAVKRKKEKHAGMGELENMKNRPMILIDDDSHTLLHEHETAYGGPNIFGFGRAAYNPYPNATAYLSIVPPNKASFPVQPMARFHSTTAFSRCEGTPQHKRVPQPINPLPESKELSESPPTTSLPLSTSLDCPAFRTAAAEVSSRRLASHKHDPEGHRLPHLNALSEVHQISVGHKIPSHRTAVATGIVSFSNTEPLRLIKDHSLKKGDVMAVARVAGIMAVKNTSNLIPLAHNSVAVEGCSIDLQLVDPSFSDYGGVRIQVTCESTGKTGVEMEAMSGVVGAALTVVDMCKGVDRGISIEGVKVIGKKGGKSGSWGIFAQLEKHE
ncbi:MAG: hypothetical protein Q9218_004352 [Villophora microphyllina]